MFSTTDIRFVIPVLKNALEEVDAAQWEQESSSEDSALRCTRAPRRGFDSDGCDQLAFSSHVSRSSKHSSKLEGTLSRSHRLMCFRGHRFLAMLSSFSGGSTMGPNRPRILWLWCATPLPTLSVGIPLLTLLRLKTRNAALYGSPWHQYQGLGVRARGG
ncbi:hypothetical protein OBBRIDRAFT_159568 [Obba rivulosa]|uniref:Uncharacterized protein n=1 Tax=Obba rivulosa TaxID=1052685 RepID=A0A8E2DGR4_9APHY|nr:hypothetical protein OBBRIDRAFT_159568 [Obba rivulosa]